MGLLMNFILLLMSSILVISSAITSEAVVAFACAISGCIGLFVSVFILQTKGY